MEKDDLVRRICQALPEYPHYAPVYQIAMALGVSVWLTKLILIEMSYRGWVEWDDDCHETDYVASTDIGRVMTAE